MKKSMRIIVSLALVVVMCLTLASCGKKLSGTYEAKVDAIVASYTATYEFSGSNVEITKKAEVLGQSKTTTFEGTYEITGEDDVYIRLDAVKYPLTFSERTPGQDDLSDPVTPVRVRTDSISGSDIERQL